MNIIENIQNEWQAIFINSNNGWIYLGLLFGSMILMYLSFLWKKKNIIGKSIFVLSPIVIFGSFIYLLSKLMITTILILLLIVIGSIYIYGLNELKEFFINEKKPKPFWKRK